MVLLGWAVVDSVATDELHSFAYVKGIRCVTVSQQCKLETPKRPTVAVPPLPHYPYTSRWMKSPMDLSTHSVLL